MPATPGNLSQTPLREIFHGDPLARFLAWRGFSPLRSWLFCLGYGFFYGTLLPLVLGRFADAVVDWPTQVIVLVVFPLLLGYYAWEPFTIQALFDGLRPRVQQGAYNEEKIADLMKPLSRRIWFWLALAVGLVQAFYIVFSRYTDIQGWQSANLLQLLALSLLRFLAFYAVTFILVRQIWCTIAINRFLTIFPIEIAPLHPDKASGLRPLGYYVLSRGFVIGVMGLLLGMALLRIRAGLEVFSVELAIELGLYVLVAPALFLSPLLQANRLMTAAREKVLEEISRRFEREYYASVEQVRQGGGTQEYVEEIEALQKLYDISEKAPTWPLNLDVVSKFSAAVVLPVLMPLLMDFLNGGLLGFMDIFLRR